MSGHKGALKTKLLTAKIAKNIRKDREEKLRCAEVLSWSYGRSQGGVKTKLLTAKIAKNIRKDREEKLRCAEVLSWSYGRSQGWIEDKAFDRKDRKEHPQRSRRKATLRGSIIGGIWAVTRGH